MTTFFNKVMKWIGCIAAMLIILMALMISITRMLTPYFNHHLPDFEAYASKTFQAQTTIEHVSLSWAVYEPELVFDQVLILDAVTKKPAISIRKLKLDFSIIRSLLAWQPMLDSLKISGVHFTLREQAKGEFNINGFGLSVSDSLTGASVGKNGMLAWIFLQPKLQLHEINIDLITSVGAKEPIILDNVMLKNSGDDHSLHGQAIFQQEAPTSAELNLNWHGDIDDLAHASATIYLYLEGISLPERFSKLNWRGWQIEQGIGSVKIWAEWKENTLQSIQSQFQVYDLTLASSTMKQSKMIQRLSGNANWKRDGVNQVIEGEDILIDLPQHLLPTMDFSLTLAPTKENQWAIKTVKMSYLNLVDTIDWLNAGHILPDDISKAFAALNMQGEIKNLSIDLPIDTAISLHNSVIVTDLNNVSFDSLNGYPAVKNLTGKLNWDGKQGNLQLNSTNLLVVYPKIFQNLLHFDLATGQVIVNHLQSDVWTLSGSNLALVNQDINIKSNFEFNLGSTIPPNINLTANFFMTNAGHLTQYLPQSVLGAPLNKWLKQAFLSGKLNSGAAIIQGNLKDYPFSSNNGKFFITTKVKDLEFSFAPDWPVMHRVSGDLTFSGSTMTANVDSGFFYDVPLSKVNAVMTNIGIPNPSVLEIQGLIQFDLAKGLYFIHHSPLEKVVGEDLSAVSLQGPMDLNLGLTIPIAKPENTAVKGQIKTTGATLNLSEWNLALEKLNGVFEFTADALNAKDLQCSLLGQDAKLMITTLPTPDKKGLVRVNLQSQLQISALEKWLGVSLSKIVNGNTAYQAELDLASHGSSTATHMTLRSDLKGISINAPAPYNKAANVINNFTAKLFVKPGQPINTKIYYGDLLAAALTLKRENNLLQLFGGNIQLGKGDANWSNSSGLSITGKIDQFDWDTWKNYFDSIGIKKSTEEKSIASINNQWRSVDVLINKLTIMGQELEKVRIQLSQLNNALQVGLTTDDMKGQIVLPIDGANKRIQAKFERLYFSSSLKTNINKLNPNTIPPISFVANDVRYDEKRLGSLAFDTSPSSSGLSIDNLSIISHTGKINATGDWELSGSSYQTHVQGNLETDHVSEFLAEWDFDEPNLIGNKGSVKFNLDWPDAPYSPAPGGMSGEVTVKLGDGQIVNLSGANAAKLGFGRMLSILSLQTLPRRLSLNFSDLTQKGYSFDYITGDFTLSDGNAYTKNLLVNGPVARVDVAGRIGLKAQDYDLTVSVTPYVTSSLPVVATIASGFNPIAGVATWLIDKAVSQSVSNVTTYHYTVTGPWSKPVWRESGSKKNS